MADYNSPFTGEEIDKAVYDMSRVKNFVCVWGTCCALQVPSVCVDFQQIPINPDTGDRTGFYYIVTSNLKTDMNNADSRPNTSMMTVTNEQQQAAGTGHVWINESSGESVTTQTTLMDGALTAYQLTTFDPEEGEVLPKPILWYIHQIFRYQSIQKTDEPSC